MHHETLFSGQERLRLDLISQLARGWQIRLGRLRERGAVLAGAAVASIAFLRLFYLVNRDRFIEL